jgi:hypothetical protein
MHEAELEVNMTRIGWVIWLLFLLQQPVLHAAELRVRAVDASGAGIPGIEVAVRCLDQANSSPERILSDSSGWSKALKVSRGLYQIRAIGNGFMRSVKEVYVDESTRDVVMEMRNEAIIDYSVIKAPDSQSFSKEGSDLKQRIAVRFTSQTEALDGVRVLYRDSEGNNEKWYVTDASGRITIDLTEGPTFIIQPTVILVVDGKVYTFELLQDCSTFKTLSIFPQGVTCMQISGSLTEIKVP